MNQTIETILNRRSVRSYDNRSIEADVKIEILNATLRAPTAGNLMLYSIIELNDQNRKTRWLRHATTSPLSRQPPGCCFSWPTTSAGMTIS